MNGYGIATREEQADRHIELSRNCFELRLAAVVIRWLASVGRSRRDLLLENIAVRQQLATKAQRNRPRIRLVDRAVWIALRRVWSRRERPQSS